MDADKDVFLARHVATHKGEVMLAVQLGTIQVQIKIAVIRGHLDDFDLLHLFLARAPVFDDRGDGANLQLVFLGEFQQFRQTRHRAVVIEDFAEHADGAQAREAHEVNGRLGVAGALEDAAGFGAERENMPRLHEIIRHGGGRRHDLDRPGAVGGADAGADALGGIHADLKIGAMAFAILLHHAVNAQLLEPFAGGGDADEAAAELGHEIDGGGRGMLAGADEVALVFAVGVVHDDDEFAFADIGEDGFEAVKFGFHRREQASRSGGKSHTIRSHPAGIFSFCWLTEKISLGWPENYF